MMTVSDHICLRNPVIWASEGQIFGFLKKHVLGRKSVQEWSRTDPKASLEAKLCKCSPRVEILRIREESTEIWPTTSQGRAINKSFLYVNISQKFQREVNAWAIFSVLRDFGCSGSRESREKCVGV